MRGVGVLLAAGVWIAASAGPAGSQGRPAPREPSSSEAARIAAEGIAIGSSRGAGGDPLTSVAQPEVSPRPSADVPPSIAPSLGALGDPGGIRGMLADRGLVYSLTYTGDLLALPGGRRGGTAYGALFDLRLDADLERVAGWAGASARANVYEIVGHALSRDRIGTLLTVSSIEARSATRLFELWFDQKLFDDQLGLRLGQIAANAEFAVSQTATLFANASFGWPALFGTNVPSGGPNYPLPTPGIRAKYVPDPSLSVQAGLFNGDPAGPARPGTNPDPERRNRTGTAFRTGDPAFVIGEVAYAYGIAPGSRIEPGTATLGAWRHLGRFSSPRFDTGGGLLADPASNGVPRRLRGNGGVYAMIDQTLYREPDDPNDGASAFLRVATAPSDRNLLDLYVDGGISYRGLLDGRSDDTVGIAFGLARYSGSARAADADAIRLQGAAVERRSREAVVEVTYQAVVAPGVTVQPDLQVVLRPGGAGADGGRAGHALVLGLRTSVRY